MQTFHRTKQDIQKQTFNQTFYTVSSKTAVQCILDPTFLYFQQTYGIKLPKSMLFKKRYDSIELIILMPHKYPDLKGLSRIMKRKTKKRKKSNQK